MKRRNIFLLITGCLVAGLIAGYFIANVVIRKKVEAAIRQLPASMQVNYRSIRADILNGDIELEGIDARYSPEGSHSHEVKISKLTVAGISFMQWVTAHRVRVRRIRLEGVQATVDEDLLKKDSTLRTMQPSSTDALINAVDVEDLKVLGKRGGEELFKVNGSVHLDSVTSGGVGQVRVSIAEASYTMRGSSEDLKIHHLELDSKNKSAKLDALEIEPFRSKEEIGRIEGHQVDVLRASLKGIAASDLDVRGLMKQRLSAGEIIWETSRIYVYRDRRLPLKPGEKPMPVASLDSLPVDVRVGKVRIGTTHFEYEEQPKEGRKTGKLLIEHFHGVIEPLINRPRSGDPAHITVRTEGSLMGSGSVTAIMEMPLHKHGNYEVHGAFHDLDVTRLNDPAENLGQLHLESGMLNQLDFQFEMGEERSTGKIVGEYHDLVVDKMKLKNGEFKKAWFKSFALKKFIIPKNKDKSLAVKKRTGKVDYKRDKERQFSYYMLHSLLVGVKSSFSLGFLLPG